MMRLRVSDVAIVCISALLLTLYLAKLIPLNIVPVILTVGVFAILATSPYFIQDFRLRFFGYFFFGALIYWTVGTLLAEPHFLTDYFFILALSIGNATGALIATIEKSEHSYIFSISATAAFFSSFLVQYTASYPDISTLILILLVLLSAMWVHLFQNLKSATAGLQDYLLQSLKTAIITSPVYLLLLVIPSYVYHILNIELMEMGVVLFRYGLLSFVVTIAGGMIKDFVVYLGGYQRDYSSGRAVFKKLKTATTTKRRAYY
ncbi:MAG: hypothetical protein ACLFVX_07875 [Archaeoglobaceae archaeon]